MNTKRQFLLGLFFLSALSILAFYTLFLTDFTLFRKPVQEIVYFPHANYLREGDPVLVAGVRIGRVKHLEVDSRRKLDMRIQATLNLDEPVAIREGYAIEIQESTMLGGRHVEIDPGPFGGAPAARLEDGGLRGSVQKNPIAALGSVGDLVEENRATFQRSLENFDAMVADAREMVASAKAGQGMVGRLFTDEELARGVSESVENLRAFSADAREVGTGLREGRGLLGAVLYDEELAANWRATVADLRGIADDLRAGRGTLGRLFYDEELAAEVDRAVRGVSRLVDGLEAGEGVFGRLLTDEALANDVSAIVADIRTASADLRETVAQIRAGEGSLGKLVTSPELYDELLGAVKLLTRSLEDYREAAPITAFTSVLFAGF
ncbi:MAG: MlaD family protein [Planctomycetota bacterium]